MFYGVLSETILFIFLLYTPGVNGVFGGRYPIILTQTIKLLPVVPRPPVLHLPARLGRKQKISDQHEEQRQISKLVGETSPLVIYVRVLSII